MPARIALIHALSDSVEPIHAAFDRHWPDAVTFDLLDTSLSADLATAGRLTPAIHDRFSMLGRYAAATDGIGGKTRAILFTCSAFGPAIDRVKAEQQIPVFKPNEAAFAAALGRGKRIGLLVTFGPSLEALGTELRQMAVDMRQDLDLQAALVPDALAALKSGDAGRHDQLIAEAARRLPPLDALILGQFSMARAAPVVATSLNCPVITTPDAAVLALKSTLGVVAR